MLQEGGLYFVVEMCRNSLLLVVVGLLLSLLWPTWREGLDKGRTNAAFLSVRNMKLPRSHMSGRDILNNLRSIHVQGQNGTEKKISVHGKSRLFFSCSSRNVSSRENFWTCNFLLPKKWWREDKNCNSESLPRPHLRNFSKLWWLTALWGSKRNLSVKEVIFFFFNFWSIKKFKLSVNI